MQPYGYRNNLVVSLSTRERTNAWEAVWRMRKAVESGLEQIIATLRGDYWPMGARLRTVLDIGWLFNPRILCVRNYVAVLTVTLQ